MIDMKAVEKVEEHIADVTSEMRVAKEETFGPLAPLFRFKTEEEVLAQANDTESVWPAHTVLCIFKRTGGASGKRGIQTDTPFFLIEWRAILGACPIFDATQARPGRALLACRGGSAARRAIFCGRGVGMQKILVPIDGSENALRAVRYAIGVAKGSPATQLHLLHVQEPMPPHVHAYFSREDIQRIEAEMAEKILRPARQLCDQAEAPCLAHLRIGPIAQTIVACGVELACGAIIMGTRGMGAIANLIVGSVTTKVIHLASVPVTLVK